MKWGINRRDFLVRSGAVAGGSALGAGLFEGLVARAAMAAPRRPARGNGSYGPLVATQTRNTGETILALPLGFQYVVFGVAGEPMTDGNPTPKAHDGMAAFALRNGNVRLVRNHEDRDAPGVGIAAGNGVLGDPHARYDGRAAGGTTSLEVEPFGERRLVRDFVSINGTFTNCAGGATRDSWITCEETTEGPRRGWEKRHGYCFEVPAQLDGEDDEHEREERDEKRPVRVVLPAMGRFSHEALAPDTRSGVIYETEDAGEDSGLYRFVPRQRNDLAAGGRLQMLAIEGRPNYATGSGQTIGEVLPVAWVDIDDPDPDLEGGAPTVFAQGFGKGGTRFRRLEGCWFADGTVFFHSTNGGDAGLGQVWAFTTRGRAGGELRLLFESRSAEELDGPDNITVSPRGGLVLCEDGAGEQFLRGLTRQGEIFDFARNLVSDSEFAGACFSPDGDTLFVNLQGDTRSRIVAGQVRPLAQRGMTFAIWGPWQDGGL